MQWTRRLLGRPQIVYRVLVPLLVVFWFVADVDGGIGTTGWAGFFVTFVVTVLFTITLLARLVFRRLASN
jgi:hypothetical protein